MRRLLLALVLLGTACTAGDSDSTPDAGTRDAGSTDRTDAGAPDAGPGPFDVCEGECRAQTVAFAKGPDSLPFSNAAFGLTPPSSSASGEWELYVEAWEGGFTECPANDSPTPSRTLILSGLRVPSERGVQTDGKASIVDFDGDIVTGENPLTRATAVSVSFVGASLCLDADAGPCPDSEFVALDLDATFPEGSAQGRIYAVHCDSLDE